MSDCLMFNLNPSIAGSALQFRQAPGGHDEAPPVAHVSDVPPPRETDPAAHVQTTNPQPGHRRYVQ